MEPVAREILDNQQIFAAYLRDPEQNPAPRDIEDRRLAVYRDLIYNNIESFISGGFPILRSLLDDKEWHALVRQFIRRHRCTSPYFVEISQEFLRFLQGEYTPPATAPKFLLELAHYEWVELALEVSEQTFPQEGVDSDGDVVAGIPVVSPLAWPLSYQFPVHRIGPDCQPSAPPPTPTFLVVYRNREDDVQFLEINVVTMRLLQLLADQSRTGRQALTTIAAELARTDTEAIVTSGADTLREFFRLGVLCGVVPC